MYVCVQCFNRFRMYHEDEERHTETCPHCGSEYFDYYSDEGMNYEEEEKEEECESDEAEENDDEIGQQLIGRLQQRLPDKW